MPPPPSQLNISSFSYPVKQSCQWDRWLWNGGVRGSSRIDKTAPESKCHCLICLRFAAPGSWRELGDENTPMTNLESKYNPLRCVSNFRADYPPYLAKWSSTLKLDQLHWLHSLSLTQAVQTSSIDTAVWMRGSYGNSPPLSLCESLGGGEEWNFTPALIFLWR